MNGQTERPVPEAEGADIESQETEPGVNEVATAAELAKARATAEENWDRYLRASAEIENVRKRSARDVEHARKFALENFAREMLEVKDSLEMGLAAAESADVASLVEGSEATLKLLETKLEQFGIATLDPEGEPFDPEQHEALSMQPSPDIEPGSVLTVIQKGYVLNGRLLRPARVIVAAEMPAPAPDDGQYSS